MQHSNVLTDQGRTVFRYTPTMILSSCYCIGRCISAMHVWKVEGNKEAAEPYRGLAEIPCSIQ